MTVLPNRRDDLISRTTGLETVVYDDRAAVAHALAPLAGSVFALCDGRLTVSEAARRLGCSVDDVAAALHTLAELDLLSSDAALPGSGLTRRAVMSRAGLIGAGTLAVSVAAPLVAAHASGGGGGPGPVTYVLNQAGLFNFTDFTVGELAGGVFTAAATPYTNPVDTAISNPPAGFTNPSTGTLTGLVQGASFTLPLFLGTAATGNFTGYGSVAVPNGGIFTHPGSSSAAVIRYTNGTASSVSVSTSGQATRIDTNGGAGAGVGVAITTTNGLTPRARAVISNSAYGNSVLLTSGPTTLPAGASIDLVVDNNGAYANDSTELTYSVTVS